MRMHTAVKLNNEIVKCSSNAELVIINFPAPPQKLGAEENCILYQNLNIFMTILIKIIIVVWLNNGLILI